MSPVRFYRRRFLNERGFHTFASVIASIVRTKDRHDGKPRLEVQLELMDCSNIVRFEFGMARHERRNSVKKAWALVDVLQGFASKLEEEVEWLEEVRP